jgi:hypothetical protein
MTRWLMLALVAVQAAPATEPPPTRATALPLTQSAPVAYVTAAAELPHGRLVVSDHRTPAVVVLDPATGRVTPLGSIGAGPGQYVQPGGLYPAADGSIRLLDRAQARVLVITSAGEFGEPYSIEVKGVRTSSSGDRDVQHLDARGFAYFSDRFGQFLGGGGPQSTMPLVRFEPVAQAKEVVVELGLPETKRLDHGNGMVTSRGVYGSPADGWGVAPDGRVAVVRGQPYRVDWIAPDGRVTRGPDVPHTPLPMTEADRQAYLARAAGGPSASMGAGTARGSGGINTGIEPSFADTKAPFNPEDVFVSPDAEVWVQRTQPAGVAAVIYDVFDSRGRRAARLEFPAGSRVIGFGRGSVYVRETDAAGSHALRKYGRR